MALHAFRSALNTAALFLRNSNHVPCYHRSLWLVVLYMITLNRLSKAILNDAQPPHDALCGITEANKPRAMPCLVPCCCFQMSNPPQKCKFLPSKDLSTCFVFSSFMWKYCPKLNCCCNFMQIVDNCFELSNLLLCLIETLICKNLSKYCGYLTKRATESVN